MRSLLVDVRPLRESRAYRGWWLGSTTSMLGGQLTAFALLYAVWETTHDPALVGGLAVAELVPTVAGALLGGSLADRLDRRRVMVVARSGQLLAALLLALAVVTGRDQVVVLYVLGGAVAGATAFGAPATRAVLPRLLPRERLAAGLALGRLGGQVGLFGGPMLAGVLTAVWGVQVCFVVDALTTVAALAGIRLVPVLPPEPGTGPDLRGLLGTVALVGRTPVLLGAFLTDLAATVLAMPVALFPVVNAEVYGGSPAVLGLFAPALGIGGILAGALSGPVTASVRPGRLMLLGAATWAVALGCYGLTRSLPVALVFLLVAGAADTVSVVTRTTIVQLATPDRLRGRVSAVDFLVGVSGPQIGSFRAGLVAAATSGTTAAALGGATSLAAVGLVALLVPALRRGPVSR